MLLGVSCSQEYKYSDTDENFFSVEDGKNTYYFEKTYMSKPEAQDFIKESEKALSDISDKLGKDSINGYSIYIGQSLENRTYNDKIELSGIVDKSVNYARYYVQATMGSYNPPRWFMESFSDYYGREVCNWGSDNQQSVYTDDEFRDVIIYDFSRSFLDLSSSLYDDPSASDQISNLANDYFEFILEKHGKEKVIKLYEAYNEFESIMDISESVVKSEWLSSIGVKHVLDGNDIYYASNVINPDFINLEFDRNIVTNEAVFYYSTSYISDDEALEYSGKIMKGMDNVLKFLAEGQVFPQQEQQQMYILTDTDTEYDLLYDYVVLSGVKDGSSSYISHLLRNVYKHDIDPWVEYGINTLIEKQFSEHDNSWTDDLPDPKQIIQNKGNLKLLSLDRNLFGGSNDDKLKSLSFSLVEYIIKEYGKPVLMELYNDTINFEYLVGDSFDKVKHDWIVSLGIDSNPLGYTGPDYVVPEVDMSEIESNLVDDGEYIVYETTAIKYFFEKDYLTLNELCNFVKLSTDGVKNIKQYLTPQYIDYDGQINLYIISDEGASSATENNITLKYVKNNLAEYVHECVHAIQGYYYPNWLSEGMATLINHKYSAWGSPPNYRQDFQKLSKRILFDEGYMDLLTLEDEQFIYQQLETEQNLRFRCYILAAGLCEYIEKTYGKEIMMELYINYDSFEEITGINYDVLVANWVSTLK